MEEVGGDDEVGGEYGGIRYYTVLYGIVWYYVVLYSMVLYYTVSCPPREGITVIPAIRWRNYKKRPKEIWCHQDDLESFLFGPRFVSFHASVTERAETGDHIHVLCIIYSIYAHDIITHFHPGTLPRYRHTIPVLVILYGRQ